MSGGGEAILAFFIALVVVVGFFSSVTFFVSLGTELSASQDCAAMDQFGLETKVITKNTLLPFAVRTECWVNINDVWVPYYTYKTMDVITLDGELYMQTDSQVSALVSEADQKSKNGTNQVIRF